MAFQLVSYDVLVTQVKESIRTLIITHKKDPNKQEQSLNELADDRRIQAQFLLKIVEQLDAMPVDKKDPNLKAKILNTAVYHVREQIYVTYQRLHAERSTLYNSLTSALGINKDNMPSRDDLVKMYSTLLRFLRVQVYSMGDPSKGYLPEQPLSESKIKGYLVETDIVNLTTTLFTLSIEQIKAAQVEQQKKLAEALKSDAKSSSVFGIFSMFSGGADTAPEALSPPNLAVAAAAVAAASASPSSGASSKLG